MGHQDIQTTMRYAHLSPGYLREAVNRGSLAGTGSKTGSDQTDSFQMTEEDFAKLLKEGQKAVAGGLGIEPRFSEPKSDVLPLDDPPSPGTH